MLKAITATGETTGEASGEASGEATEHGSTVTLTAAAPQSAELEVEPEQEEGGGLESTPLITRHQLQASVSVDIESETMLNQLIEEVSTRQVLLCISVLLCVMFHCMQAKSSSSSKRSRVNIKETERRFQRYMTPAMQSGSSARASASAA